MKYIDADALKKEIKYHIELMENEPTRYAKARIDEANEVLSVIDSFQQKQPDFTELDKKEQSKIDWESEIEKYWITSGWGMTISLDKFKVIARYFIGLALNAKNKEIKWHYL